MLLRRCSCALVRAADGSAPAGGSTSSASKRLSDFTDNLGSAATRVGSIFKNIAANPRATERVSPRVTKDQKPVHVNPETSDKEYLVAPNFPMKQEPLSKEGFHHYLREHALGNHTVTWVVGRRDPDASVPIFVRDAQISEDMKAALLSNLSAEELALPPKPPAAVEMDWGRLPRRIEYYPPGFPEEHKQK